MRLKILIVDDEPYVAASLRALIAWNSLGCEVIGLCNSGHEALLFMQNTLPNILLCDIKMPGISGLDVIEHARRDHPALQCIIVSGYAEFALAQKALLCGAVAYCLKPFDEREIVAALDIARARIEEFHGRLLSAESKDGRCREDAEDEQWDEDADASENLIPPPEHGHSDLIAQALQYTHKRYMLPISIMDISHALHVSPSYFSALFKKVTGENYTNYITRLRIGYACRMLSETDMSVTSIATSSGYSDYFYFAKVFKRVCHVTPTQYRQKKQSAGQ